MPTYAGINGVVRKLKEWPVGINGVVHQQKEVWASEGGVKRKIFSAGVPINSYPVGTIVNLKESTGNKEFIIVHKGVPGSDYDSSCNGVWVMRNTLISNSPNQIGSAYYENSTMFTYVNSTYYNSLDPSVKAGIKLVKIPYVSFAYGTETYKTGAYGLQCRCFILSGRETGLNNSQGEGYRITGSKLGYFSEGNSTEARNKRKAIYESGGYFYSHATRDPGPGVGTSNIIAISETGDVYESWNAISSRMAARPVFVLDNDFVV